METTNCSQCNCELTENDFIAYSTSDEAYCETCESEAWQYANTVLVVQHGETKKYLHCTEFGFRDAEYWEEASPNGVTGFKYVRTDAWRGYHDPIIEDGYTTLASGWSTGNWSDVAYKHKFNDFVNEIAEGEIECPYELVFAFGLTSNVFSVSSDVIIKTNELESFTEWLAEYTGYTVEDLESALR